MKRYLLRQEKLIRHARTMRYLLMLGPWRAAVIKWYQWLGNTPLPTESRSHFSDLDVAESIGELNDQGYAAGFHLAGEAVEQIMNYCRANGDGEHINPHLTCDEVRQVAHDPKIVAVVKNYLGTEPIIYRSHMYWVRPQADQAQNNYVTHFHYDVGDFKCLLVFIYLTDVDEESFPHMVIAGTHKNRSLRKIFTRMLSETTAREQYGDRIKLITGRRGATFFEDVTCYHKRTGGHKPRLVLQITYVLHRNPETAFKHHGDRR